MSANNRIARCQTMKTAEALIVFLKDKTQPWEPPVGFMMVLKPGQDGVEVRPDERSALRKADREQISGWVREFVASQDPREATITTVT
jgi:hypothetical protein